jgi:hypothetical protein
VAYPSYEEFQHQRRVIRETFPRLFEAVEEQLRFVDENLPKIPTKRATKYDLALSAHLARATKTTMGIVALCEHGYGEIAMSSLRTLGETMVSAYFLALEPEEHADRFEAFARQEALDNYRLFRRMGWDDSVGDVAEKFEDPEHLEAMKELFPNPVLGWMQVPMKDVLRRIEKFWERPEELRQVASLLHLLGDRHSHVGTFDTVALLRADEQPGLVLHLGPERKWVREALLLTAWVYGQMFDLWAEHFAMPDLESWRRRYRLLNARCRSLDPDKVRGLGRNALCPCGSGFKFKRCHADLVA